MGCDAPISSTSFSRPISIHAPTWGATARLAAQCLLQGISIHAPTWGATDNFEHYDYESKFQSTHPRGVRHNNRRTPIGLIAFQSTHPRGVRHNKPKPQRQSFKISIHAPTWGATVCPLTNILILQFQSTHPRGVRPTSLSHNGNPLNFNPRTHVGCDFSRLCKRIRPKISIHAPTWGATFTLKTKSLRSFNFNPRTHVGCDMSPVETDSSGMSFQSTHPRGVRLQGWSSFAVRFNFNPRTHVGCDSLCSTTFV